MWHQNFLILTYPSFLSVQFINIKTLKVVRTGNVFTCLTCCQMYPEGVGRWFACWLIIWLCIDTFWLNPRPHTLQINGFSPVWIRKCRVSLNGVSNRLLHSSHLYFLSERNKNIFCEPKLNVFVTFLLKLILCLHFLTKHKSNRFIYFY